MTAAFQGFGNVAQYAVRWFTQAGGRAVCVSCWDGRDNVAYTYRKMDGVDPDFLVSITDSFGAIDKRRAVEAGYDVLPGEDWIKQRVDILIPCAWRTRSMPRPCTTSPTPWCCSPRRPTARPPRTPTPC